MLRDCLSATFKWVRGELIGRGTYGRVYLVLNATTGEMIAVKQVDHEYYRTDDTRLAETVRALKKEGKVLKELLHPNIVHYLGLEETSTKLDLCAPSWPTY